MTMAFQVVKVLTMQTLRVLIEELVIKRPHGVEDEGEGWFIRAGPQDRKGDRRTNKKLFAPSGYWFPGTGQEDSFLER